MKQYVPHYGHDAKPVIVTIDGADHVGELEAWRQEDDDSWTGYVRYAALDSSGTYTTMHLGWFPAEQIRPDETDYSAGR